MRSDLRREELKEIFDDQVEGMIALIDEQINNLGRKHPGEQIGSGASLPNALGMKLLLAEDA